MLSQTMCVVYLTSRLYTAIHIKRSHSGSQQKLTPHTLFKTKTHICLITITPPHLILSHVCFSDVSFFCLFAFTLYQQVNWHDQMGRRLQQMKSSIFYLTFCCSCQQYLETRVPNYILWLGKGKMICWRRSKVGCHQIIRNAWHFKLA